MKNKIIILFLFIVPAVSYAKDINMLEFGANPDGITDNTHIIQRAIDECSQSGGGVVFFPAGRYLSGSIFLKDNVTIELHKMSVLSGITKEEAYPGAHFLEKGFIRIDSVSNVSIIGEGTIDGNGGHQVFQKGNNGRARPYLVHCRGSKNIVIKDITLTNSAFWTLRLLGNEFVRIDGLTIYSHANWNNDGIDIDSKDVIISNCFIDVDDDAICFKSDDKKPCENVTVNNCIIASNCNAIKMGTASHSGFKNITISNCVIRPASVDHFQKWPTRIKGVYSNISNISGIALEMVDKGVMEQINITNISMTGVQTPIFIKLGARKGDGGVLKNVIISNITATTVSKMASSITAYPGSYVENVVLRDILIRSIGNGVIEDAHIIPPENEKGYPENRMFGDILPCYGFFIRHVKNILFDNVQVQLLNPDARPVFYIEDVSGLKIQNMQADVPASGQPLIKVKQVKGTVTGFQSAQPLPLFIESDGAGSKIRVYHNDFSNVTKISEQKDILVTE